MKVYGLNELRSMYLEFFESKNHLRLNSFSLVPHNDKSLLLINSGMAPLKPYFTGVEIPPSKRITTCQKCIRTGDIENVGKTSRHGTFFEMLGNFSFGDYFKKEAIQWSWEFLTKVVGLEEDRLYPSIFDGDDEAFEIWNKDIGISPERIFKFGRKEDGTSDNFWEHGAGPCGPCSEIYYDRGQKYGCNEPGCTVGCECDRYIEVWNNVFTQFEGDGKGNYTELSQKNIDTGMGLERLAAVVQDVDSIFDVDTIKELRETVCEFAKVSYKSDSQKDISIRLITDHIRSATFMISDGIMPSNEGRGYVLRRLIRRAARHGRLLEIKGKFLSKLSEVVIRTSKDGYPELEDKKDMIFKVLTEEENKFDKTIDQGLFILSEMIKDITQEKVLDGDNAFKLYDTYGFPLDLTKEILEEHNILVDEEGFKKAMEVQRKMARDARKTTNYMGADTTVYEELDSSITSRFVGYDNYEYESVITALTTDAEVTQMLVEDDNGTIIVEETPFYPTMGGQEADKGVITIGDFVFEVKDTIKLVGDKIGHVGKVVKGEFKVSDKVLLKIDKEYREKTKKNHSATHLLQKALRTVLGNHVEQAGSYVNAERLRFDFTHFQALTDKEIEKIEEIVNKEIENSLEVITNVMSIEEAKKSGAMALFGEKYSDSVRVVTMGEFSKELCGGTHVSNTSVIRNFKIVSETGIAAGIRRIEAYTADGVLDYYKELSDTLYEVSKVAKAEPNMLAKKIESLLDEIKTLNLENEKLKNKLAKDSMGNIEDNIIDINGVKFLAVKLKDVDANGLRNLSDDLKSKLGEVVIVLASSIGGDKVNLLAVVTDEILKKGIHAGNIIKEISAIVGGGGGGRPNLAQAGGKDINKIDDALKEAENIVKKLLTN